MKNSLRLIPAFFLMIGCDDVSIYPKHPTAPPPEPAVMQLRPGNYEVVVEGVQPGACRDLDLREVDGAHLGMRVRFEGPQAFVTLEDLPLEGWMRGGTLRAFGSMEAVVMDDDVDAPPPEPDEGADSDDAPDEDAGADSADAPDEDRARSSAEDTEVVECEIPEEEPDRDEPAPAVHGQIELILDIEDAQHALGALNVTYGGGCHLALDVSVRPGGGTEPVEETEPGEPPREEPCDEAESDCG